MCFIRVNNIDYSTKVGGVNVGQEGELIIEQL